ncbi:Panacea domain-containing protein [Maribacter sp. 2304DJ31-5]|uniref:Panacea domain-containing protein n=1 Tax=Maribacter sp. 2304DJ31-5 TaxID=3386273 RepID=UPI0039BCE396
MNFGIPLNRKGFTKQEIDKLGNTIIYLSKKIPSLSKTQCLKLLYFLDEFSIKKYGIPVLGLKYEIWQFGPVSQDVYVELTSVPEILSEYITTKSEVLPHGYVMVEVLPKKDFNDDEFSDNDMFILEYVVAKFGRKNASEMSDITHREGSLWHQIAQEKGLLELFEKKIVRTSNYHIDFSRLLDDEKKKVYIDYIDNSNLLRAYNV